MSKHLRILAWLYIVMGALSVSVTAYFWYAMYETGPYAFTPDVQHILVDAGYGTWILALLAFVSVGSVLTGYALLKLWRFARTLATVFALLGLLDFPFGTMLGIYTLWVLSQPENNLREAPGAL